MDDAQKRSAPSWLWNAAAVVLVAGAVALVAADRSAEPGESLRYALAAPKTVETPKIAFRQTAKLALDFKNPQALATTGDGRFYVAGEATLAVFGAENKELKRIAIKGTPDCVAIAPDGEILLGLKNRVQPLDPEGAPKAAWAGLGDRAYITSIAAGTADVYVADAGNCVVIRCDRNGNMIGRIGGSGGGPDTPKFIVPSPYFDVAFDPDGALWVVNPGKHGLESYRANGAPITSWYRSALDDAGFCGCCNPIHVAFRRDGSLVTAEKGVTRVKVYAANTQFLAVVAGPEALGGTTDASLSCSTYSVIKDLAVDSADRILVLDGNENAVRIFEQETGDNPEKVKS